MPDSNFNMTTTQQSFVNKKVIVKQEGPHYGKEGVCLQEAHSGPTFSAGKVSFGTESVWFDLHNLEIKPLQ